MSPPLVAAQALVLVIQKNDNLAARHQIHIDPTAYPDLTVKWLMENVKVKYKESVPKRVRFKRTLYRERLVLGITVGNIPYSASNGSILISK
jgi:hypothetical protein